MTLGFVPRAARGAAPLILAALALPSMASAQATRTWVSGVGDDANPCSRTAPCKTFAGAISKTAAGGEINALDDGGFGAVTITKAITIEGGHHTAGVLVSGTNGVIINAASTDRVTLRNLEIDGLAGSPSAVGISGVRILKAKSVRVEHSTIFGFGTAGIEFAPSAGNLAVPQLTVNDTTLNGSTGVGILTKPTDASVNPRVVVNNSSIDDNNGGGIIADGTVGGARVTASHNSISGNGTVGVRAIGANGQVRLNDNVITGNAAGVDFLTGGTVLSFGNNAIFDNDGGLGPSSTTPLK